MSRWIQGSNNEKPKLKKNINKSIEDLQKWKQNLDLNKNNEPIASPQPITTANNILINNNNREVETNDELSMNSLEHDA
jgi:hypothetical protein